MGNKFDTEKQAGIQLRALSGDIGEDFRKELKKLYNETEIGKICYEWHTTIQSYCGDNEKSRSYVALITYAFEKKFNLNESKEWLTLMRLNMGPQFNNMMEQFTQVPQLAARFVQENKERNKMVIDPWV